MIKRKNNKSLVRIFLLGMLFVSFISTAIIGYLWVSHEFRSFDKDAERMRHDYIESQKLLVKNEVRRVAEYIGFARSRTDKRLKDLLKEKVYEAHAIASNIYRTFRNKTSGKEIQRLIKEALRPIRFNNGRGYFFINRLNGILELYPVKPHIEGQDQWYLQDSQGTYVVRNEVELVKNRSEGFLEYEWRDTLRDPEIVYTKVSFVKYFQPFNWYIGSKEYREDFTGDIQRELLERIGKIRFGKNGYIFMVDYEGVTLWNDIHPELVGKKVWVSDEAGGANALRLARQAVEKPGGDFIDYTWFKPSQNIPLPKTSFVMGIKDWQWIIGAGVYLEEIDRVIAGNRIEMKKDVTRQAVKILGIFFLVFAMVLLITFFFAGKLRNELGVFLSFFKKSAVSFEKIDKQELVAREFMSLAGSVNRMLEERQKVENSLRESEERLAVTFRSLAEGVITTDMEQKVVLMNQAAEILLGRSLAEVQGKPLREVFPLIDEKAGPVQPLLAPGAALGMEPPLLVAGDGARRSISHNAAPICDQEGKAIGSVIVFQDITEKKRWEEEVQKIHKLDALGLLAGGIAHDFNNLLSGIMGNISLAKVSTPMEDKVYEELEQAEKATLKAKQLAQQMLTFARGGVPLKKVYAVTELIEEAVSFALRGSNIKCDYFLPKNLWPVEVDGDQVNQVLYNIIINAVQAMPDGGTVTVIAGNIPHGQETGLEPDKKYIKIAIKDNGPGIPQQWLKKIFDPYFSTKPKGCGLGLTTVYSIIKKHEGMIRVESEVGKGSTFTIYIPASEKEVPPSIPEAAYAQEDTIRTDTGNGRVLVMDDDPFVGDVAIRMLTHLGYQPEVVVDGGKAIESYKKALELRQPFKIVIMDLTIPGGMGGVEAMRELLKIDPLVKAIVSSGYSNDPIMGDFQRYGFLACLKKPYRLEELSKTLTQVV